jgi:hypothetical protein
MLEAQSLVAGRVVELGFPEARDFTLQTPLEGFFMLRIPQLRLCSM